MGQLRWQEECYGLLRRRDWVHGSEPQRYLAASTECQSRDFGDFVMSGEKAPARGMALRQGDADRWMWHANSCAGEFDLQGQEHARPLDGDHGGFGVHVGREVERVVREAPRDAAQVLQDVVARGGVFDGWGVG